MQQRQLIAVERLTDLTPEAAALLDALDRNLGAFYSDEQMHGLEVEALFQPNVHFFIARLAGTAVGCGGVALRDGFAEVKRMYTDEAVRGRGVAKALLTHLESVARDAGLPLLRLETGIHQHEAIAFYERLGFELCDAFGDYADMTPRQVEASVFYEKPL